MSNEPDIEMPPTMDELPPRKQRRSAAAPRGSYHEEPDPEMVSVEEEEKIAAMLEGEEDAGANVWVYRTDAVTRKKSFLVALTLSEYDKRYIAEQFGGGDYHCRIRRSNGSWGSGFSFSVDKSVKPKLEQTAGTSAGYDLKSIVELMQNASREDKGLLNTLLSNRNDNGMTTMLPLMMKMMETQAQTQTALFTAMMGAQGSKGGMSEKLIELLVVKSLDGNKSGGSMKEMIEGYRALQELAPQAESKGLLGELLSGIGPAAAMLLPQLMGGQQPQLPASPQPAALPEQPSQPSQPQQPAESQPVDPRQLIGQLLMLCKKGVQPDSAYDVVQAMLTDDQYFQVVGSLQSESWFELLVVGMPEVEPHKEWFSKVRDLFIETDEEPVAGTPSGGI